MKNKFLKKNIIKNKENLPKEKKENKNEDIINIDETNNIVECICDVKYANE